MEILHSTPLVHVIFIFYVSYFFCKDNSLRVCIDVKRHHYQGNSYKGKYLVGWLTYSSEF